MILKLFYLSVLSILLSGCFTQSQQNSIPESQPIVEKKQVDEKIKKIQLQKQKRCDGYIQTMKYARSYVVTEFEKGYFTQNDIVGAKAQLFLIQSQSQSLFAKNINDAENSYNKHYELAKKLKCDLKGFSTSPVAQIKNTIEVSDAEDSL